MRAFRSLGVNSVRTRRAFTELKRKSFHLLGLLIPSIYYLGLRYSNGVLTQSRGVVILGIPTFLLWVIEVLRWISPVFRGHYNRIFSSMLRAQEKAALAEEERILTEGSFAHQVDQLVEAITTPLLGELPASPSSPRNNNGHAQMEGMHTRGAAAAAAAAAAASAASAAAGIQSASSKPLPDSLAADYSKSSRAGPIPLPPIARDSPRSGALHSSASSGGSAVAASEKSEKVFTGTGFFFLGCWLSVVWFTPTIGTASMLNLVLGDMSAAIVGISWGSLKIGKKSLEGTLAMFGVCCMIGSIFFSSGPQGTAVVVVLASLTATMVELLGPEKCQCAQHHQPHKPLLRVFELCVACPLTISLFLVVPVLFLVRCVVLCAGWCDDNITIPLSTGIAYTIAFNLICGGVPKDMS